MRPSTSLTLARALYAIVGIGALLMVFGQLTSGSSLADPVFPAGAALGVLALGSAMWFDAPGRAQAIVVWLGLLAVALALVVFTGFALRTPSPDVLALVAVPTVLMVLGGVRLAMARRAAGALGG